MNTSWIQSIVTMFVTVLGCNAFWAFLQSKSTAKSARDRILLGLCHDVIFRNAEFYLDRGAITSDELDDLEKYFFKPYSELGGNGTAASIMEKCRKLPIVSAAKAERMDKERGEHK